MNEDRKDKDFLERLVEDKMAYCEKHERMITEDIFYSCRCFEAREIYEYCPHFSEIRKLKGRKYEH